MRMMRRRWFLGGLAALAAAGVGIYAATRRPAPTLITSVCAGDASMSQRILVADATKTGSTAEVAEAIARRLCEAGLFADVRPVAAVATLDGFSGAVLGSAVRYAAWLPEMTDFMATQRDALAGMPVAFFTMHMLALGDDPSAAAERAKYTLKAHAVVSPVDEAFLAGKIDPAQLSLFDRLAVRLVKSPVGDRRDWAWIGDWTAALAPKLA